MNTKTCSKCGQTKPLSDFNKTPGHKFGRNSYCKKCSSAYGKTRYQNDKERILAHIKEYYQKNREKILSRNREHYQKRREFARIYRYNIKIEVLAHYSHGDTKCACCGEKEIAFLTIDHINNDGSKHRKSLKIHHLYHWLKRNNFPENFQVLCYNCNCAKGHFGYCPHQKIKNG